MNDNIVSYLRQYKDSHPQVNLVEQLRKTGYIENEIQEAVTLVYGGEVPAQPAPAQPEFSQPNFSQSTSTQSEQTIPVQKVGKIKGGYLLAKQSFQILKKDKEIILFPIFSSFVSVAVLAMIVLPISLVLGIFDSLGDNRFVVYTFLFIYYLISYFVIIFFNSGLVACAHKRMNGGDPTFRYGFSVAMNHIGQIFVWAVISATVGLLLRIVTDYMQQKFGFVGSLVGTAVIGIIGFVWGLMTYFVVPVIIIENLSPKEAIKQSKSLFLKTWGENFIGNVSMSIFFFLLGLIAIIPIILSLFSGSGIIILTVVVLAFIYWLMLGAFASAMQGIFVTALYLYAKTGSVPQGYDANVMQSAFTQKPEKKKSFGLA